MKVTLIGCGGLGSALARGLSQAEGIQLTVCDKHPEKGKAALAQGEGAFEPDLRKAATGADVVLVAVKPPAVPGVCVVVDGLVDREGLVVSLAAGLSLAVLAQSCRRAALARAMPNTGSSVGAGTTALVLGPRCEEPRDSERLLAIFGAVGQVRALVREDAMHAATAVAGSGPAFALLALEAMMDAGVAAGFSRNDASFFARGAFRAAVALADEGVCPAELRARIASPGGTTIAGLGALEKAGARSAFWDAIMASIGRSREMGD
jgi:pyrroline-5-carboxylate reductase